MTSIESFIFDSYGTIFNVDVLADKLNDYFPGYGKAIHETWRDKQLDYAFSREIMGNYTPFSQVTRDALHYAIRKHGYHLSYDKEVELLKAYLQLPIYPEVKTLLRELTGKQRVILSNGSPDMLHPLVFHSGLLPYLNMVISTDDIKRYKPNLSCYHYATTLLHTPTEQTLYVSAHGWGIAGAKKYGFNTALINRDNSPIDRLDFQPNTIYTDLLGTLEWINH